MFTCGAVKEGEVYILPALMMRRGAWLILVRLVIAGAGFDVCCRGVAVFCLSFLP